MKVYVVLGRYGDIYMVCKQIKEPSVVFVSRAFCSIVKELFPHLTVFVFDKDEASIGDAMNIAKLRFPDAKIACCQQNGLPVEVQSQFRNYQSYQEFQANEF